MPFDTGLLFVLDDPISSKGSKKGALVRAHLKDALTVNGIVVAPAGTPEQIRIVAVSPADIGDVYGFVDIFFEPMALPDGRSLPLRAPYARLEPRVSSGHQSTVALEDEIEDQVIPYHFLYHIFRKGKNFVLNPGAEIPGNTEATIEALPNGTIAIETPRPLAIGTQMPRPTFPVQAMATPFGPAAGPRHLAPPPTPHPSASPSPSPAPTGPTPTPWPTVQPPPGR